MKKIFYSLLMLVLFHACKDKNTVTTVNQNDDGSTTTTTTLTDGDDSNTAIDEMNKKVESLKKLAPLSMDELNKLIPEEMNGAKRSNFSVANSMGFSMVQGEFQKNDSTQLSVMIYDCAGDAGSGIFAANYWTKMTNYNQQGDNGYTKTIDFNGNKAFEMFDKSSNEYTLTYLAGDRLLVVLSGKNLNADELKQAAQQLNFKAS